MRIPRKIKKKYKTLWYKKTGEKRFIIKKSIEKTIYGDSKYPTWECITDIKK